MYTGPVGGVVSILLDAYLIAATGIRAPTDRESAQSFLVIYAPTFPWDGTIGRLFAEQAGDRGSALPAPDVLQQDFSGTQEARRLGAGHQPQRPQLSPVVPPLPAEDYRTFLAKLISGFGWSTETPLGNNNTSLFRLPTLLT